MYLSLPARPSCESQASAGVVKIISVGPTPLPVDEQEVASIQKVCRSGSDAQPWPFLQVGWPVRVECGPLVGTERHRTGSGERISDCCFSYAIAALGIG